MVKIRNLAHLHTYMPIRFTDPKPVNMAEYETCQQYRLTLQKHKQTKDTNTHDKQ
jgi:hypothetical protein